MNSKPDLERATSRHTSTRGQQTRRSPALVLLLIAVGAFALRVVVSVFLGDNHTLYYEYMTIADNLLHGRGYSFDEWGRTALQPSSFLPPLYVYWCALFMHWAAGNYLPMYIAQALVAATGCIPAYLVGRDMYSRRVGWGFAVAYAIYPEFAYLHSRPVSEFLYVVLALWILYLYIRLRRARLSDSWVPRLSLLTGLLGAIAVLVKEATLVFLLMVAVALALHHRPLPHCVRRLLLPLAIGGLVGMAPWVIRNAVVQHQFIPIRTGYGITLWLANHHGATGTDKNYDGSYVLGTMDSTYLAHMNSVLPVDEQDRDRIYVAEVKRFIQTYPLEYLKLCGMRIQYYLWFDPTHPIARSVVYRLSYILLLLFAIPGAVLAWRRHMLDPLVPLVYFGYLFFYAPVLVLPRYRIIPVLMLLLMASFAVSVFLERRRTPRVRAA